MLFFLVATRYIPVLPQAESAVSSFAGGSPASFSFVRGALFTVEAAEANTNLRGNWRVSFLSVLLTFAAIAGGQ
jgi:hypothetical protein